MDKPTESVVILWACFYKKHRICGRERKRRSICLAGVIPKQNTKTVSAAEGSGLIFDKGTSIITNLIIVELGEIYAIMYVSILFNTR